MNLETSKTNETRCNSANNCSLFCLLYTSDAADDMQCVDLGVPTTRALSLVSTGEMVLRDMMYDGNQAYEQGAVVCRVAPSFIRFGSFQIHSAMGDIPTLKSLLQHTVDRHFPGYDISNDAGRVNWLNHVAEQTALMISHWMRVGFVHGVMNTDNISIHGLTIDLSLIHI